MIGNVMEDPNQSAWVVSTSTVGQILELDFLYGTVQKKGG